jgi:hypothetical protein
MSIKNFNETIANRTRDLPACSAVPQPTALPRATNELTSYGKYRHGQREPLRDYFNENVMITYYPTWI